MPANPYETLIDPKDAALAPPVNPYDTLIADPKQQVRANVSLSVGNNPESIAAQRRLAQYLGYRPAVGEALPEQVKAEAAIKQVDSDTAGNPVLQKAYTNEDFAKIGHDDSSVLGAIEKNIQAAAAYVMGATPTGGVIGTIKAMPAYTTGTYAGIKRAAMDVMGATGKAITGEENWFTNMASFYAQQAQASGVEAKRLDTPSNTLAAGGLASGVQSLFQNAKYMPLALAGPAGGAAALGLMAAETFGQSYNKAADKNLPLWKKLTYGASDAVVEFWTERAPLFNMIHNIKVGTPLMQTILKNAWQENKGEQVATVLQDFNEWMSLNQDKSLGDYLSDRPAAAVQTLLATLVGAGGNVTLAHSIQKVADTISGHDRQADYAASQAQILQDMLTKASESKLKTRDPQTFSNLIQQMAEETPGAPTHVYIDARTLAETLQTANIDTDVFNQLMPTVAPQLREAIAGNSTVELPIGDLAAHVAGTPLEQALLPHLRIGSEGALSQVEAQQAQTEQQKLIEQQTERIIAESQKGEEIRTQAQQIQDDYAQQIHSAGVYTADQSASMAIMLKAFYVSRAALSNQTPEQVRQQFDIKVQGVQEAAQAPVRNEELIDARKRESVLNQLAECL